VSVTAEPLVDRQFLERLERLTLRWQKSFRGIVGGHNLSHFAGRGQEFLDHRSFHQGDDLRAVNWRAYMRFEKLFLKMFQVEPRVPVRLLIDISASMTVGHPRGDMSKFDYVRKLAAALAYVGLVRLDSLLLQPFGERLEEPLTVSGGRHRFKGAELYLRGLKANGETNFIEVIRQFLTNYPQHGLVVILSDFLDEGDCLKPLQYLADFGHELMLVQLWGQEDRQPADVGELDLVSAENGSHLRIAVDESSREAYTRAFDEYSERLQILAQRNGGRYAGVSTHMPVEDAIFGPMLGAQAS
jgi:uncharacterized protein (DUF58 family)